MTGSCIKQILLLPPTRYISVYLFWYNNKSMFLSSAPRSIVNYRADCICMLIITVSAPSQGPSSGPQWTTATGKYLCKYPRYESYLQRHHSSESKLDHRPSRVLRSCLNSETTLRHKVGVNWWWISNGSFLPSRIQNLGTSSNLNEPCPARDILLYRNSENFTLYNAHRIQGLFYSTKKFLCKDAVFVTNSRLRVRVECW